MAEAGWNTVLATVFTATVLPVTGFALSCQLDKGLSADADYMALRRAEDRRAATILGFNDVRWIDMAEAPHRGYHSAVELFGAVHEQDNVLTRLTELLDELIEQVGPNLTLIPQALGNHVDHQLVLTCAGDIVPQDGSAYYRDTPYAIRKPEASPVRDLSHAPVVTVPIQETALARKVAAAQAYTTQVNFQFGNPERLEHALRDFAISEGGGRPGERFLSSSRHMMDFTE